MFSNAQTLCITPLAGYDSVPTRSSLLSRLRNVGDDASWRIFFETYWRLIYNVARKSGLADSDAQDVVQETVICVARNMPEFRYDPAKGSFKQWLLLITRRRIQDHLRQIYRAQALVHEPGANGAAQRAEIEEVPCPALPPDAQIEAAWETEWRDNFFQAALAWVRPRANPKQYQAFDYCVLQGMKAGQTARLLGLSAPQVYLAKHRISLMVKQVAKRLEAEAMRSRDVKL